MDKERAVPSSSSHPAVRCIAICRLLAGFCRRFASWKKMTLYLIGIGLFDEKDITLRGLGIIKKCRRVYLETYTSRLNCSIEDLEKVYGKEIIPVGREFVEHHEGE